MQNHSGFLIHQHLKQNRNTAAQENLRDINASGIHSAWSGIDTRGLSIKCMDSKTLMSDEVYIPLWRKYVAMDLSANGILNFQEWMIYYCPAPFLSPCGTFEIPKPCIIDIWGGWRRNVTNYIQGENGYPKRRIRYAERVKWLKVAMDCSEILMEQKPTSNTTIH